MRGKEGKDTPAWQETKRNIREARYRLSLRTESLVSTNNGNMTRPVILTNQKPVLESCASTTTLPSLPSHQLFHDSQKVERTMKMTSP